MKTQKQIQVELDQIQLNIDRLKTLEITMQTIYFVVTRAPERLPVGILDRARAITDKYLSQFTWDGTKLVSLDPPKK